MEGTFEPIEPHGPAWSTFHWELKLAQRQCSKNENLLRILPISFFSLIDVLDSQTGTPREVHVPLEILRWSASVATLVFHTYVQPSTSSRRSPCVQENPGHVRQIRPVAS